MTAREIVVHAVRAALRIPEALHGHRVAHPAEIPHEHVEEVDRLLEDPRSDRHRIVPPAAGALAVGKAEQAHHVTCSGRPILPSSMTRLISPHWGRQPELVADGSCLPLIRAAAIDAVAIRERVRHRLLEQHMLAGLERRDSRSPRWRWFGTTIRRHRLARSASRAAPVPDGPPRRDDLARGFSGGVAAAATAASLAPGPSRWRRHGSGPTPTDQPESQIRQDWPLLPDGNVLVLGLYKTCSRLAWRAQAFFRCGLRRRVEEVHARTSGCSRTGSPRRRAVPGGTRATTSRPTVS